MALTLALCILVALTTPMLALLSASALEPLIARNLVDASRAFYLAEAGIESALTLLADSPGENGGPTAAEGEPAAAQAPASAGPGRAVDLTLPADLLSGGTTSVTVQGDGTHDIVILTSTGMVNGARRTIEVTVQRPVTSSAGGAKEPVVQGEFRIVNWRER